MRALFLTTTFMTAGLCAVALSPAFDRSARAQVAGPANSAVVATTQTAATSQKAAVRRKRRRRTNTSSSAITTIPLETAPPTPITPASRALAAHQRSADQRLLTQQQSESNHAASVNNQTVREAQKQQENVQGETRIQDAPGPAQTGVVPGAGTAPTSNPSNESRIQDAPGPAQTVPQPAQPQSSPATPSPATPPPQ